MGAKTEIPVELNHWADRCVFEMKAVCDIDGQKVKFHAPEGGIPTSGSLNPEGFNGVAGKCIEVETTRLDTYFRSGPFPDLIKIDVENYENVVLQGMAGLFDKGQRPTLIIECLPNGPIENLNSILVPLEYSFYHLTPAGHEKYGRIIVKGDRKSGHCRNWLLVPKGKMLEL